MKNYGFFPAFRLRLRGHRRLVQIQPHPRVLFDVRPPHYYAIVLLPMLSTP
jgi:hypothetical protein